MRNEYPLLTEELRLHHHSIPVYLDICDMIVRTPGEQFVSYEQIIKKGEDRMSADAIKDLLRRMEQEGILRRFKDHKGRFAPFTRVRITRAGLHFLTCGG